MAQVIKIKRSTGSAAPQTIAQGELAYSKGSDTFYIGDPEGDNSAIVLGPALKNNAGNVELAGGGVTAAKIRTAIGVDEPGTDNSTNVTLNDSIADILSIGGDSGQEIGGVDNGADGIPGWDDSESKFVFLTAEQIRTIAGVDAAGTDNSTDVTLAGSLDYLSLENQVITLNSIDLTADVTGTLPVANGGTGATTLTGIKQALDLEIGTDVLAYDDNLQSFVTTFELPVADGQDGQVLKTDGNGNLDFVTVSFDDIDVNEPNLRARLAELTEDVTIGDADDVTVTITGNLVVSGTTTTLNTEQLLVEDNIITLNSGVPGDQAPSANAGIEVNRGNEANTSIRWNEGSNVWEFTNDGTNYNVIGYGDITGVEIISTDGSITGGGTGESGDLVFDLEVGTIDGGTYGT